MSMAKDNFNRNEIFLVGREDYHGEPEKQLVSIDLPIIITEVK